MATTSSKTGIGTVVPVVVGTSAQPTTRRNPTKRGAAAPHMVWLRADRPFHGEGTRVTFSAEPGVTQRGWLPVPFRFQYPPLDSLSRSARFDYATQMFPGGGVPRERSRPTGRGLRTLPLRMMFTDWDASSFPQGTSLPHSVWSPDQLEPILAARELEQLCMNGIRFRIKIRNRSMYDHDDVNMLAVITSIDVEEQAGEPDTRYVSLQLQEYVPTQLERDQMLGKGPWMHTLQAGDTLYKLARLYYGKQTLWPFIAAANPKLGGWAPSRLLSEWATPRHRRRIRIPARPKPGRYDVALTTGTMRVGS